MKTSGINVKIENIADERLFENPFTGIILVTEAGEIVRVNGKMCAVTGYADEDLRGLCLDTLVHPDNVEDLYANCSHMPGQRRNRSGIFLKFRKKGGQYIDCILNIVNLNDERGKITGHVLFFDKYTGESLTKSYVDENGEKKWVAIEDKDRKEEFLCNIFHGIQDSILILDINGNIISYNMKLLELLDLDIEQMSDIGNIANITPKDINIKVADKLLKDAFSGTDQFFTWQLNKPACGTVIDVEVFVTRINKMGDEVLLVTVKDITDKKMIEDSLKSSESRYRQLVELSPDGIVIHKKGVLKYINPAGAAILGAKTEEEILGRNVIDFFPVDRHEGVKERLNELYVQKRSLPLVETDMLRVDGSLIHVEYAAMPFEMDGTTAVQVVIRDVTEKKKQDEYIRYLALHDKLTGLPNRELLADRILKAMKRRGRDSLKNAVIYLDLDAFKPINDTLGHDAGDKALQEIAVRLEDSIRASDTAARIGGDEFVILLEGVTGLEEISAVAERILEKINEPLNIDDHEFLVGASLGVSVYPDDSQDHSDLMSMADKAMYYVKETGKNRYAFYADIPGKL
jgi:diguanylate cyclase (GGDEF)-like protein/PAS domain S-box-containing protein